MRKKINAIGEKVVLKTLTEEYVTKKYLDFLNDPEVTKYLDTKANSNTLKSLGKYVHEKLDQKDCLFLAILDKNSGLHIGNIKIEPIDFHYKRAVVGIMIGDKNFWGKGYGEDAMRTAIKICFQQLKLNKVALGVISEHKGAIKSYKRAGFIQEGLLREDTIWKGKKYDRILFGLLKGEFRD